MNQARQTAADRTGTEQGPLQGLGFVGRMTGCDAGQRAFATVSRASDWAGSVPNKIARKLIASFRIAANCGNAMQTPYIPHIEDAIWHEFSGRLLRPKRLLRDAEQSKQLTLQVCELDVEDLHGLAVLDELVSLSEAE